ncbi:hypothetical protein HZS_5004 [Henneguya salminicola]|nr:hypothetical protein HZS_5004 [Henneguya salminicola]
MIPEPIKFHVINQINSVILALKIQIQRNKSIRESLNKTVLDLENSKIEINKLNEIHENNLRPLFYVISNEETDCNTTAAAVQSLNLIISCETVESAQKIVSLMIDTINDTKFSSQGLNSNELVLFEITEVFKQLIARNLCSHLTDEQMCACLQSCFRIYFEQKFSDVLRRSSCIALTNFMILFIKEHNNYNSTDLDLFKNKLSRQSHHHKKRNIYFLTEESTQNLPTDNENIKNNGAENTSDAHRRFGVPTLYEFLRFLISLTDPNIKHNKNEFIEFSLSLISIAFEIGSPQLTCIPSILDLIRSSFCKNLNDLFFHDSLPIFCKTLQIFRIFMIVSRSFFKYEIEILLISLMDMYTQQSDKISCEKKELIRDFILDLFDNKLLLVELFLNYDVQVNCHNLFEYMVDFINQTITIELYHRSLVCLLSFITTLDETFCNLSADKTFICDLKLKKHYNSGISILNSNLSKGIEYYKNKGIFPRENYEPILAQMFKYDKNVDRKLVGESIGNRKYLSLLDAYVRLFDVADTRIDQALRFFLESFRISGESPVISNILEVFSRHYFENNLGVFENVDAVFTLCYAIIMLNVDQHNTTAKLQKSMDFDDFINNLKGVNSGNDFPIDLLKNIYETIHVNEIVVPIEQSNPVRSNYIWRLTSERSRKNPPKYHKIDQIIMQKCIFRTFCSTFIKTLCFLMHKNMTSYTLEMILKAYYTVTKLAAKFQYNQTVDKLVIQLLKFSSVLRSANESATLDIDSIIMDMAFNPSSGVCLIEAFKIIGCYVDCLTLSWKYVLACVANLCAAELLPVQMYEFEDFVDSTSRYFLQVGKRLNKHKYTEASSSFLNSFVQMIITSGDTSDIVGREESYKTAQNIVSQCKIDSIFNNFKQLSNESFVELSKGLVKFSSLNPPKIPFDMDSSESDSVTFLTSPAISTFFFETLMIFCLSNKSRIDLILPEVTDLIHELTVKTQHFSVLNYRAMEGSLRFTARLIDTNEHVSKNVLISLRSLLTNPALLNKYPMTVIYGIYDLLRSQLEYIKSCWDWVCILEIIEIAGCGRNSLLTSVSIYPEILENLSNKHTENNSSYHHCDAHMFEIYQQKALYDAIDDGGKEDLFKFKSSFAEFDFLAFSKSVQCFAFLINNQPSNLTYLNILPCVHALTTFSERIFYLSQTFLSSHNLTTQKTVSHMNRDPNNYSKIPDLKQLEIHTNILLELMFSLFCHSSIVLINYVKSQNLQILTNQETTSLLWHSCWSHLLKRIVVFVIDFRRHIRLSCMHFIERALRIRDIQVMPMIEWFACFQRILLPMLKLLITNSPPINISELDETKTRSLALVSKLFLQNLSEISKHQCFSELWKTILDIIGKYHSSKSTDVLQEALPEYLKNMLSVMTTAGVIDINDISPLSLWNITQIKIKEIYPDFIFSFLGTSLPINNHKSDDANIDNYSQVNNDNGHTMQNSIENKPPTLPVSIPNFKIVTAPRISPDSF